MCTIKHIVVRKQIVIVYCQTMSDFLKFNKGKKSIRTNLLGTLGTFLNYLDNKIIVIKY